MLDARQISEGWGSGVIPQLALDIRNDLPEVKGFSARNLGRMLAFTRAYPQPADFLPQLVAKMALDDSLLWQLPWVHHALLLEKVKALEQRRWYMTQTLACGWSRNTLAMQIDGAAHARQGQAVTNFASQLPPPHSDLAQQALKDPYIFDFLTLDALFHERELETGLVQHLEKFLLELGQGFTFVGRQYHLAVGHNDF